MTETTTEPIKTPFYDYHVAAGAKMIEFAGFVMPVQYTGIVAEHRAVRSDVGLFDLSHMGEFEVRGSGATAFLQRVTTNNCEKLKVGQIQYSCMTLPTGGIVDDLLVYRMPEGYLLIVNAANLAKDFQWLKSNLTDSDDVELIDISGETGLLAIQGPKAQDLMSELTDYNLQEMPFYSWAKSTVAGREVLFSRTGYTGEDGFEIYIPPKDASTIWEGVISKGEKHGLQLIGLGARDSLRLEMKMALYGNDIDDTTTPVEAGLSWIVDFNKDFIGKDIIAKQKADKPDRRLVCMELTGKAFPRHGYKILDGEEAIGHVTSGTFSPSLSKPIAMGYVVRRKAKSGSIVQIAIRDKRFEATVVKPPFYKNASHK